MRERLFTGLLGGGIVRYHSEDSFVFGALSASRTSRGFGDSYRFAQGCFSEDQGVFEGYVAILPVAFDVLFARWMEPVDAEAVFVFGDYAD